MPPTLACAWWPCTLPLPLPPLFMRWLAVEGLVEFCSRMCAFFLCLAAEGSVKLNVSIAKDHFEALIKSDT